MTATRVEWERDLAVNLIRGAIRMDDDGEPGHRIVEHLRRGLNWMQTNEAIGVLDLDSHAEPTASETP